jgi:hypothetical protein
MPLSRGVKNNFFGAEDVCPRPAPSPSTAHLLVAIGPDRDSKSLDQDSGRIVSRQEWE